MSAMVNPARRWRARHLFSLWFMYWVVLAAVALSRPLGILWGLTHTGVHGDARLGADGGAVSMTVHTAHGPAWSGHIGYLPLTLWIALPPLLLWVWWIASRPRAVGIVPDDGGR